MKNVGVKEPLFRKEALECLTREMRYAVTSVADLEKLIGSKKRQEKKESQGNDTRANIHLEEGEMICDKCEGEGVLIFSKIDISYADVTCDKCAGTGKVDWVENVVGKKSVYTDSSSHVHINNDMVDAISYSIRENIDKNILETIQKEVEQINKIQTVSYMVGLVGGCIF